MTTMLMPKFLALFSQKTDDHSNSAECWGHVSHGKDLHAGDTGMNGKKKPTTMGAGGKKMGGGGAKMGGN